MEKITLTELTPRNFALYGTFTPPDELRSAPVASSADGTILFWSDCDGTLALGHLASNTVARGRCVTKMRPHKITDIERHLYTAEGICPGGDVYLALHVPTAGTGNPPVDGYEVFRMPKGYRVNLKAGVWHHAPHNIDEPIVTSEILLPPGTYLTDCECYTLDHPIEFGPDESDLGGQ